MTESIPQPPEFADGPPMPEMCDATLSSDDVANLFADLAACTQILAVQEKGSEQSYAAPGPAQLESAMGRLLTGDVRALQIRYVYQEREWTDTLMNLPIGIRLIRCQHADMSTDTANARC